MFDYDPAKSQANLAKHGIDFDRAQDLWQDARLLIAPGISIQEERWLAIGTIEGVHWTAVLARRGQAIRIISVRRARRNEVQRYEGQ